MSDPHEEGRISRNIYYLKTEIRARVIAVLDWSADDRNMALIPHISRAVRSGEMLELIATDETGAGPGATVNNIGAIGFIEVSEGGLLVTGDMLTLDDDDIGEIVGFNETHMPNHLNIVIKVDTCQTGREMDLKLNTLAKVAAIDEETQDKQMGF